MNTDNDELVIKAKTGDKRSLEDLIRKQQKNILATLYYLKIKKEDLEDVLQNVLFKLSKKIYQLKNPKYFKTWLNQIIINTYYDYLRKNKSLKKDTNLESINSDIAMQIPDFSANPQEFILNNELDFIIQASIDNLPIHYKIPITLREVQGLSYSEISDITNTSIGTVKSRIARAREKIKNDLSKYSKE